MDTRLANRSQICAFGSHNRLRPVIANVANNRQLYKFNPYPTETKTGSGAIHEYIIGEQYYLLVTSLQNFDVVRCPDKTYAKVDRRTKTLIGPYTNNER